MSGCVATSGLPGAATSTALNGELLIFVQEDGQGDEEVIAAMEAAGFTCTQDERLVARAAGWWFDGDDAVAESEADPE